MLPAFLHFLPASFLWDLWWWEVPHPLRRGEDWDAGAALESWELAVAALAFFLGVALEEPPWPLSPPPPLGLPSGTLVAFLVVSPRHTFLWVCTTEEETKACFKHFPQPRVWHCSARLLCGSGMTSHSPKHKHRRGRMRALLICLASQLVAAIGTCQCEAL